MIANPRILITNDDGVDAPGLQVMIKIARQISDDVFVIAPADNQSGVGHRFSFGRELSFDYRGSNVYALNGTPADCVVAGCTRLLKDKRPDIVLSGVNLGQNLGDIIHCSGTMAGAREGVMQGALGIGMSQAVDFEIGEHSISWDCAAKHGAAVVRQLMQREHGPDTYFNVNFPLGSAEDVSAVRVVPHQRFSRSPFAQYPSHNEGNFFIAIPETPQPLHPEHDFHVLHHDRAITVTPLSLRQTDEEALLRLQNDFLDVMVPAE